MLDARRAGPGFPANNLTPRGLVVNLGQGYWVAFDVDLLRVAAVWRGNAVTPKALAPGSYHASDKKTQPGQSPAPEPDGTVWMANGIYPGWQSGPRPSFDDPREPAPSPEEVGRGPLSEQMGRFKAIRQVRGGVVLEYTAGGAEIQEWLTLSDRKVPERHVRVGPSRETLWLLLGIKTQGRGDIARLRDRRRRRARAGDVPVCESGCESGSRVRSLESGDLGGWSFRDTGADVGRSRAAARHASAVLRRPVGTRPDPAAHGARDPDRRSRAAMAAGGHQPGSRARQRRTRTSWTTSRCRSTIPGAGTCA